MRSGELRNRHCTVAPSRRDPVARRHGRRASGAPSLIVLMALSLLVTAPVAVSLAQRALDANLRLSPQGYRSRANTSRSHLQRYRYIPGASRNSYRTSADGGTVYRSGRGFGHRSHYNPTGYSTTFSRQGGSTLRASGRYGYSPGAYRYSIAAPRRLSPARR